MLDDAGAQNATSPLPTKLPQPSPGASAPFRCSSTYLLAVLSTMSLLVLGAVLRGLEDTFVANKSLAERTATSSGTYGAMALTAPAGRTSLKANDSLRATGQ